MTPTKHMPFSPVFTTRQIAEVLGVTSRSAKRRAARDRWAFLEEPHPGRPIRLYPLSSLPPEVQAALLRAYPDKPAPPTDGEEPQPTPINNDGAGYDPEGSVAVGYLTNSAAPGTRLLEGGGRGSAGAVPQG